jgi:hypothetical protein
MSRHEAVARASARAPSRKDIGREILDSQEVTRFGPTTRVLRCAVRLSTGELTTRGLISRPPAVAVLPVDEDRRRIGFALEERMGAGGTRVLGIPSGVVDPGEDPRVTAARELEERHQLAGLNPPRGSERTRPNGGSCRRRSEDAGPPQKAPIGGCCRTGGCALSAVMTPPTTADREGCAVLDLPASVPEASITSVTNGADAVEMLARDADATRQAAQVMRRAHDHGWVVVARGDLGGGVRCHAEAFFESMADAEHAAGALECPAGTVLEWAPGLTADLYEPGGDLMPVPLAGVQLHGPRFTPPGLEVVVIDTDGLEALCATPDAAVSHIRNLIEELAVRLAREYPAQDELPAAMLANVERIVDIPPGGMNVPLIHDAVTDKRKGLRVLWADHLRWEGFKRALELPDRPDLADPGVGGPLARRLALEGFDEAARPT